MDSPVTQITPIWIYAPPFLPEDLLTSLLDKALPRLAPAPISLHTTPEPIHHNPFISTYASQRNIPYFTVYHPPIQHSVILFHLPEFDKKTSELLQQALGHPKHNFVITSNLGDRKYYLKVTNPSGVVEKLKTRGLTLPRAIMAREKLRKQYENKNRFPSIAICALKK